MRVVGNVDRVLIVGGGIGGLSLALALARKGLPSRVLERQPDFSEVGAGLQLAPNGSRVLEALGILDEVRREAVFPKRFVAMDLLSGEQVTAVDLGEPFVRRYHHPYFVAHRSDLITALSMACQANGLITLETGRDVVSFATLDNGQVEVRCADDARYRCDTLIGADGLRSRVRQHFLSTADLRCTQFVAYRGTVPVAQLSAHGGLDNVVLWMGPAMHMMQYPVRGGALYNQVAVFKSERYREDSDDWGTPDELDDKFSRACGLVRDCAALMSRTRRWPLYDMDPTDRWVHGRVALMGDAAHPMLQYMAQGASQTMEDAVCLAEELARRPGEVEQALLAYRDRRCQRTARVQLSARFMDTATHLAGPAATLRNEVVGVRAHDDYTHMDWLFNPARSHL